MANSCCVDHIFYLGENPTIEAKDQFEAFVDLVQENKEDPNDHSSLWYMVKAVCGEEVANSVRTRSLLTYIGLEGDTLRIEEETAWRPCTDAWDTILANYPLLGHAWAASEPANLLFEKCDPDGYFNNRLWVVHTDACPEDGQHIELGSDAELWEFLDDNFNTNTKGMEPQEAAALAAKKAEEAGCFLALHQYEDDIG